MVDNIENLKLTTTITNTGDETLNLLTGPNSLLETVPTHKFTIRNVEGGAPLFIGSLVHSILDDATLSENRNLVILNPGKSIIVEHDCKCPCVHKIKDSILNYHVAVSKAYDFTHSGPGLYTFEARNPFHHVESSASTPIPIYDQTAVHQTVISSMLAVRKEAKRFTPTTELASRRAPTFIHCNTDQESVVSNAITEATIELTEAVRSVCKQIIFVVN
jgi:peptidyl-Lys metalloendopeptidase